jgi:hypothetical protein
MIGSFIKVNIQENSYGKRSMMSWFDDSFYSNTLLKKATFNNKIFFRYSCSHNKIGKQ